jgi:hypothetical protein
MTGSPIAAATHDTIVRDTLFSPDGKRLVTRTPNLVRLFDSASGAHVTDLAHSGVESAVYSANSRRIVTRSGDGSVYVWNAETGAQVAELKQDAGPIKGAIMSRDSRRILTWAGKAALLWDAETGAKVSEPIDHEGAVLTGAFTLDSRRFVTTATAGARLGESQRGTQIALLKHRDAVRSAIFSPDGRRLLTRSDDRAARLWNGETGKLINVLNHEGTVYSIAFNRDASRILTRSADKTMPLWDGSNGDPILLGPPDKLRPFANQLFAISGVSGGALGAVTLYAALADSQLRAKDGAAAAAAFGPPCRADADVGDLFVNAKDRPPQPGENWKDCLQLILAGDFLSPVFLQMIAGDLLGVRPQDRAVVLEEAWEHRYLTVTQPRTAGAQPDGRKAVSMLARPMLEVRNSVMEADPKAWLPILLLNGTSVQTGRRIIASDVDTRGLFRDAYDLHGSFGRPRPNETIEQRSRTWDVRLSTAATVSARFPGISPHGNIVRRTDDAVIDRVVDGGYYEALGAATALELVEALDKLKQKKGYNLQPFVILVNNEPGMPNLDCFDRESETVQPPPKPDTWGAFATLLSPLDAVLGTRSARGTHAAAQLCNYVSAARFAFVTVSQQEGLTKKELSMSWWLSKYVQRYLDGDLIKANGSAFEKIMSAR